MTLDTSSATTLPPGMPASALTLPPGMPASAFTPHIGRRCIIRTYASGVHFGTLVAQEGRQVELKDARRLWRWVAKTGISLSEVAVSGINVGESRICASVPEMTILDALEIIPATDEAASSIDAAPDASPR